MQMADRQRKKGPKTACGDRLLVAVNRMRTKNPLNTTSGQKIILVIIFMT
jgi:hypothetical protein